MKYTSTDLVHRFRVYNTISFSCVVSELFSESEFKSELDDVMLEVASSSNFKLDFSQLC